MNGGKRPSVCLLARALTLFSAIAHFLFTRLTNVGVFVELVASAIDTCDADDDRIYNNKKTQKQNVTEWNEEKKKQFNNMKQSNERRKKVHSSRVESIEQHTVFNSFWTMES